MPDLANFERQVKSLRQKHAIATDQWMPGILTNNDVFADKTSKNLGTYERILGSALGAISSSSPDCIDGRMRFGKEPEEVISFKQSPENIKNVPLKESGHYINTPIKSDNFGYDIIDYSLPKKHDYDKIPDVKRFRVIDSVLFLKLSPEQTVADAASHFEQNRQGYIAMALAEVFERGIEIQLDPSVDAVNVVAS